MKDFEIKIKFSELVCVAFILSFLLNVLLMRELGKLAKELEKMMNIIS